MVKVTFSFKDAIVNYDEATDLGAFWSFRFFDVWHSIDKLLIKSVEEI